MTNPPSRQEPSLRLRTSELASRRFEDETVVLDLKSSMYLSTNASGTVIWQALERGTTRTELIELLLREFDVERAQAEADVDAFLSECRKRNLLSEPS